MAKDEEPRQGSGARLLLAAALVLAACAAPSAPAAPSPPAVNGVQVPEAYAVRQFASDLNAPTALALGPAPDPLTKGSRRVYVTQLNGGENAGAGQIVAIDGSGTARDVVFEGLKKPTGLAWFNDALYVVAYRDVLKLTDSDGDGRLDRAETLARDVPFNGRSLGHIKVGPVPDPFTNEGEPRLYFSSSGGSPGASGYVYSMRLDGGDRRIVASGLKNAYAFTWSLGSNVMFSTEIGDSLTAPPAEEINVIRAGADYGWPDCPAERACADVEPPIATFAPSATPTGIAWWNGDLYVTLWGPTDPHVARLELDGMDRPAVVREFARGLQAPIDALATQWGTLLLLDFAGQVWEVSERPPAELRDLPPPAPSPTP